MASARPNADVVGTRSRENQVVVLGTCAAVVLLSAVLEVRAPETVYLRGLPNHPLPPACAFRRLTGYPCPGCGMTRSFVSTAHGEIAAAFGYHPLGPILFLLVLAQLPYRAWCLWRGPPRWAGHRGRSRWIWLCLIALAAAWVCRLAAVALAG
jgi:hypothetical protein